MKKITGLLLSVLVLAAVLTLPAFGAEKDGTGQLLCIARYGDTADFPACSAEAVTAAVQEGVYAVSVHAAKTADGVFVLAKSDELKDTFFDAEGKVSETSLADFQKNRLLGNDGEKTDLPAATLSEALATGATLVLDGVWDSREEIASLAEKLGAKDRLLLRSDADADEMAQWSLQSGIKIICVYYGNILFSAWSRIKAVKESGCGGLVQLQSGNFFSVNFDRFVMKRFSTGETKAVCAMYDKELCGQRIDSVQGFDDMTGRGYTVIETSQPKLLMRYIRDTGEEKQTLSVLREQAQAALTAHEYTKASSERLSQAIEDSKPELLSSKLLTEKAAAELRSALDTLCPSDGTDTNKGSWNVTAGKVAAVLIFGAAVIAAEIYVYKKKRRTVK